MSSFGKSKGGGRRSAPRANAPLVATVTTLQGSHSAELIDVSATGARLRGPGLPDVGEGLFVTVDEVVGFGEVAWSEGDLRGLAFDPHLTPAEEQQLSSKVKSAAGLPLEMSAAFDNWVLGCGR
jgi:hypothetical protein